MATVLEDYTTEELRAVLCSLWAKGRLYAKDIHKEMSSVYFEKRLSRTSILSCVEKFCQGRSKVADDGQPGRPVQIEVNNHLWPIY
jgi:hypothetical protein